MSTQDSPQKDLSPHSATPVPIGKQTDFLTRILKDRGQAYNGLVLRLDRDLVTDGRGRSAAIASPDSARVSGEVAVELACFLSMELGRRVLLIDATFGRDGLSDFFGCGGAPGLTDILHTGVDGLKSMIRPTTCQGVFVLPDGRRQTGATSHLKLDHLTDMLTLATADFDYVLIQNVPILNDSKALLFPPIVDSVLLLAVEGQTMLDDLEASRVALDDSKAAKIGLVLVKLGKRDAWNRRGDGAICPLRLTTRPHLNGKTSRLSLRSS